jgi:hypothetical protein
MYVDEISVNKITYDIYLLLLLLEPWCPSVWLLLLHVHVVVVVDRF